MFEIGARDDDGVDVRSLRARLGLDSGYTSRLLRSLEDQALVETTVDPADRRIRRVRTTRAGRGVHTRRLETNRSLTEALGLYRSAGYVEGPPHNDEVHAHHWFEKRLA